MVNEIKCVMVNKALAVNNSSEIPGVMVGIVTVDMKFDADNNKEIMDRDARTLYNALVKNLPGGTFDRLFALMADNLKSELLVVHRNRDHINDGEK